MYFLCPTNEHEKASYGNDLANYKYFDPISSIFYNDLNSFFTISPLIKLEDPITLTLLL